ncbi:hypothetical protein PTKIN_Ptkin02bG0260200 [Pterospermum kingtungense]
MASSQVEIVSSSPFGCVLRGHNRKERCRDQSNVRAVQAVFEKNFKDLVRDHIHGCISLSSSAQNSKNHIPRVASWVTNEQGDCNRKKEEPSAITQRHSPVLDRWVTRQAQEVTKHVNEADQPLISPPNASTASLTTSTSKTKKPQSLPSTQSENASVKHNVGASSLVQMWEARLNRSNSINSNHNQSQSTCYALSAHENNATPVEEPSTGDSFDEKGANNEDSIIDWETQSERTAPSEPPPSSCSYSRSFDGGESERVRIADIIKRLANADDDEHNNNNVTDSQSREHKHGVTSEQSEQRCFSLVVNSPRLRGRQAFNDLLILMEHDKNKELDSILERQPVTKFSRRGRLQAMLRLRCLQRSLTIQDKCRPQSLGAHVNRVPQGQGSAFMHLREKFGSTTGAEHLITPQKDPAAPKCLHNHRVLNNSIHLEKNSSSKPQSEDTHGQKVSSTVPQSTGPVNHMTINKNEDLREQTKPVSDSIQKKCLESPKTAEATASLEGQSETEMAKQQGSNSPQDLLLDSHEIAKISSLNFLSQKEIKQEEDNLQQHLSLDLQETTERTTTLNSNTENEMAEEQDIGDQQHLCLDSQEIVENSTSYDDQDESEVSEELEQYSQTNYDWFSNISRPRSYWEGLRKAWYQEVINTNSKNEEIRQLLERGRVSSCLASDFRERIDRLMISRVQMQAERADSQEEVDDEDRMVQVMSYLQRHLHPAGDQGEEEVEYEEEEEDDDEDEGEEEDEDDDDDERSLISRQYHEANNYFNQSSSSLQMPSPSNLTSSWSSQDDNETGINSDRGPSAFSPPLGPSTTPYYEDTRHESSSMISRPSLEMELIFNLRGHIEQLQQEMAELRKSILSCMDMQMKFQQYSFNREVHSGET